MSYFSISFYNFVPLSDQKIDKAYDHIDNVNAKMKDTLNEVRAADKICVDIVCIVLMVGLAAVMYQLVKTQT